MNKINRKAFLIVMVLIMLFATPLSLMAESSVTIENIIVDKTPPSVSVETVTHVNGEYTTHVTVNVTNIHDGGNPPSGVAKVEYSLDGGNNITEASFTGNSCSFDITESGSHILSVIAIDKAGNASGSHDKVQDPGNKFDFYIHGSENIHTVTFKDHNGAVISTQAVLNGENATAPGSPVRAGYTFTGWDKEFTNVTEDLIVTAQYEEIVVSPPEISDVESESVTLIWSPVEGAIYYKIKYTNNVTAENHETLVMPEYTYTGEGKIIYRVINLAPDTQYTFKIVPVYTGDIEGSPSSPVIIRTNPTPPDSYTVTFIDHDGTVIDTQVVAHGSPATAPTDPTREGYTFIGWDSDFSNVVGDMAIVALYSQNIILEGLNIIPAMATINVEGTIQYEIELMYSDGTRQSIATNEVTWFVIKGEALVTITDEGLLTALNAGSAEIGATYIDVNMELYSAYADVIVSPVNYNITYEINPILGGSITVPSTASAGDLITAIATPNTGYSFISWEREDVVVTTDATYKFTMPASNVALRANFGKSSGSGNSGGSSSSGSSGNSDNSGGTEDANIPDDADNAANPENTDNVLDTDVVEDVVDTDNTDDIDDVGKTIDTDNVKNTEEADKGETIDRTQSTGGTASNNSKFVAGTDNPDSTDAKNDPTNNTMATPKTGSVAGRIVTADGKPMANVKVELHSEIRTTFTNKNGEFQFNNVPLGDHKLYLVDKRLRSGKALIGTARVIPNTENISLLDFDNIDKGLIQCNLTDNSPMADLTIEISSEQIAKTPSDYVKPALGALLATALLIVLVPRRRRKKEEE